MDECLFCKIVAGEIQSAKIWENESHYAFFDLFPNCKGQTLVIPKDHHNSKVFDMGEDAYKELLSASRIVSGILKRSFEVERVGMIVEGMGVNHAHIKLYPMHGLGEKWEANESTETVYFESYPGYLTTKMGNMLNSQQLESLVKNISK